MKEACAVLYKRKGEYQKSISLYLEVIIQISVKSVIFAILVNPNVKFNDPNIKNDDIKRFDGLLNEIIKICDKYGSRLPEEETDKLWMYAMEGLYGIKT